MRNFLYEPKIQLLNNDFGQEIKINVPRVQFQNGRHKRGFIIN
jgi:hypothetical protein